MGTGWGSGKSPKIAHHPPPGTPPVKPFLLSTGLAHYFCAITSLTGAELLYYDKTMLRKREGRDSVPPSLSFPFIHRSPRTFSNFPPIRYLNILLCYRALVGDYHSHTGCCALRGSRRRRITRGTNALTRPSSGILPLSYIRRTSPRHHGSILGGSPSVLRSKHVLRLLPTGGNDRRGRCWHHCHRGWGG